MPAPVVTAGQTILASLWNTMANVVNANETKLGGIAVGATANATDAQLRDRATHTGINPVSAVAPGAVLYVQKSGTTWPVRPTSRTDVLVFWKGADPSPAIVASGTGGMIDGLDVRLLG